MSKVRVVSLIACASTLFLACGPEKGRDNEVESSNNKYGTGGTIDIGTGGGFGSGGDRQGLPSVADCGDGVLQAEQEARDDKNNDDKDGCFGNCRGVEPDYTCPTPGELRR